MKPKSKEVSSGCLIVDDDRVMLVHPSGEKKDVWGIPKGLVEDGETLEQTAIREVAEETGLDANIVDYIGSTTYRNGKVVHCYLAHATGTIKLSWEVDRAKMFSIESARKLIMPAQRVFLDTYEQMYV